MNIQLAKILPLAFSLTKPIQNNKAFFNYVCNIADCGDQSQMEKLFDQFSQMRQQMQTPQSAQYYVQFYEVSTQMIHTLRAIIPKLNVLFNWVRDEREQYSTNLFYEPVVALCNAAAAVSVENQHNSLQQLSLIISYLKEAHNLAANAKPKEYLTDHIWIQLNACIAVYQEQLLLNSFSKAVTETNFGQTIQMPHSNLQQTFSPQLNAIPTFQLNQTMQIANQATTSTIPDIMSVNNTIMIPQAPQFAFQEQDFNKTIHAMPQLPQLPPILEMPQLPQFSNLPAEMPMFTSSVLQDLPEQMNQQQIPQQPLIIQIDDKPTLPEDNQIMQMIQDSLKQDEMSPPVVQQDHEYKTDEMCGPDFNPDCVSKITVRAEKIAEIVNINQIIHEAALVAQQYKIAIELMQVQQQFKLNGQKEATFLISLLQDQFVEQIILKYHFYQIFYKYLIGCVYLQSSPIISKTLAKEISEHIDKHQEMFKPDNVLMQQLDAMKQYKHNINILDYVQKVVKSQDEIKPDNITQLYQKGYNEMLNKLFDSTKTYSSQRVQLLKTQHEQFTNKITQIDQYLNQQLNSNQIINLNNEKNQCGYPYLQQLLTKQVGEIQNQLNITIKGGQNQYQDNNHLIQQLQKQNDVAKHVYDYLTKLVQTDKQNQTTYGAQRWQSSRAMQAIYQLMQCVVTQAEAVQKSIVKLKQPMPNLQDTQNYDQQFQYLYTALNNLQDYQYIGRYQSIRTEQLQQYQKQLNSIQNQIKNLLNSDEMINNIKVNTLDDFKNFMVKNDIQLYIPNNIDNHVIKQNMTLIENKIKTFSTDSKQLMTLDNQLNEIYHNCTKYLQSFASHILQLNLSQLETQAYNLNNVISGKTGQNNVDAQQQQQILQESSIQLQTCQTTAQRFGQEYAQQMQNQWQQFTTQQGLMNIQLTLQ